MEHRQRLLEAETRLRSWLIPLLREKSNLAVSWECGNDEAIITFEKGVLPDHKEAVDDLEDYLYHKLELPSAGEFTMNGDGNTAEMSYYFLLQTLNKRPNLIQTFFVHPFFYGYGSWLGGVTLFKWCIVPLC